MSEILLQKLIDEIRLQNDGATTLQEFAIGVMQAVELADKVNKGLIEMPRMWQD